MRVPNDAVDLRGVERMLRDQYAAPPVALEFVPVGLDSWCYRAGTMWVSVRRDRQGHAPAAYEAARELRDAGEEFVLAPLRGRDGRCVHTVGPHPVVVFARLEPLEPVALRRDAAEAASLVERVHRRRVEAPLPREDYRFPFLEELVESVDVAAAGDPRTGPFSADVHAAVSRRRTTILALVDEAQGLTRACAREAGPFVVTHGEPSASNFLRHDGKILLADWSGTMWGPPERDWFHVRRTLGVARPGREPFLRFYELRWILGEIAEYTARFVGPHGDTAEERGMWQELLAHLPEPT